MGVQITKSLPLINEQVLNATESQLRVSFPAQYRAFLMMTNGGRPTPNAFSYSDTAGRLNDCDLKVLMGVYTSKNTAADAYSFEKDIEAHARMFKTTVKRLPDELVPIGSDSLGNLICIAVSGEDTGAIYFWDHENEVDPDDQDGELDWWQNVHFVANSFNEFLDSLHD